MVEFIALEKIAAKPPEVLPLSFDPTIFLEK